MGGDKVISSPITMDQRSSVEIKEKSVVLRLFSKVKAPLEMVSVVNIIGFIFQPFWDCVELAKAATTLVSLPGSEENKVGFNLKQLTNMKICWKGSAHEKHQVFTVKSVRPIQPTQSRIITTCTKTLEDGSTMQVTKSTPAPGFASLQKFLFYAVRNLICFAKECLHKDKLDLSDFAMLFAKIDILTYTPSNIAMPKNETGGLAVKGKQYYSMFMYLVKINPDIRMECGGTWDLNNLDKYMEAAKTSKVIYDAAMYEKTKDPRYLEGAVSAPPTPK